jgi:hypothetical protein
MRQRFSAPLPKGKGLLFGGRLHTATFAVLMSAIALTAIPAHAANVSVTLRISPAAPASPVEIKSCAVSVPALADGIAVLDAAKASHCIDSYETVQFGEGAFITCIDDLCGLPNGTGLGVDSLITFWMMSVNKTIVNYGVNQYRAHASDVLEFSYTVSVFCFVVC